MSFFNSFNTLIAQSEFGSGFIPPDSPYNEGGDQNPIGLIVKFLSNLVGFLTILGAMFFIVQFLMGAFSWISAGGDSGKIEKARNQILNGIIGLVIMVAAYSIIGLIGGIIGIDFINLEETIRELDPNNL